MCSCWVRIYIHEQRLENSGIFHKNPWMNEKPIIQKTSTWIGWIIAEYIGYAYDWMTLAWIRIILFLLCKHSCDSSAHPFLRVRVHVHVLRFSALRTIFLSFPKFLAYFWYVVPLYSPNLNLGVSKEVLRKYAHQKQTKTKIFIGNNARSMHKFA